MKRLLIITYYWPPTGGSGVQRWVKFAKYLPSFGWQPVIYTPENPEQLAVDESLLADIPACTEVLKTHISEPYNLYRKVLKVFGSGRQGSAPTGTKKQGEWPPYGAEPCQAGALKQGEWPPYESQPCQAGTPKKEERLPYESQPCQTTTEKQGEVNPINSQKKGLLKKISLLIRGNCFIPDPRVSWVRPSVRYLSRYLEEHPVDAVVTTGPPQSMHLIGLGLMKKLGKSGKAPRWIADFRDPWTEMFYFKHLGLLPFARRRHRTLEQRVLDGADTIIAVTPLVQADFQARTATPVELITNGFDEEDFPDVEVAPFGERFTIVHTGLFADDGNPEALWKVLAARCAADPAFRTALRISLAGKVDEGIRVSIEKAGLADNLELPGYLPHCDTVKLQRSAQVLILPLRKEPEYRKVLPGKIFEYLAARRPVLGIGQEDGAAAKVLEDSGAGLMLDWDRTSGMDAFIADVWDSFRKGTPAQSGQNIDKYGRKALTGQLVKIL